MIGIIDKFIPLFFPNLSNVNALLVQMPCKLKRKGFLYINEKPEEQWRLIESLFEKYQDESCKIYNSDFIIFPEDSVPDMFVTQFISKLEKALKNNSVVIFGCEHIAFENFFNYLEINRKI